MRTKSNTQKTKRLFLVAGYDKSGVADASLLYMVRALHEFGDVIVHMDNDPADDSIKKLAPYTLSARAARHGEYDFGSYKQAYLFARDHGILNNYDIVYMINDSVYGPLTDLGVALDKMERMHHGAFGLVCNPNKEHPHIQSWLIGMRRDVFLSAWFDEFITGVRRQSGKGIITALYEQGFTKLAASHGISWGCLYTVANRGVYNLVKKLYRDGMPFMKKVAFCRHNGALGRQIDYVLRHVNADVRTAILENARRTWGAEYIHWLLTKNPFKITMRATKYFLTKAYRGKL